jgi:hypothetical protein
VVSTQSTTRYKEEIFFFFFFFYCQTKTGLSAMFALLLTMIHDSLSSQNIDN